jgi:hypothetical protein
MASGLVSDAAEAKAKIHKIEKISTDDKVYME